jgi:hypothetical protein
VLGALDPVDDVIKVTESPLISTGTEDAARIIRSMIEQENTVQKVVG